MVIKNVTSEVKELGFKAWLRHLPTGQVNTLPQLLYL